MAKHWTDRHITDNEQRMVLAAFRGKPCNKNDLMFRIQPKMPPDRLDAVCLSLLRLGLIESTGKSDLTAYEATPRGESMVAHYVDVRS